MKTKIKCVFCKQYKIYNTKTFSLECNCRKDGMIWCPAKGCLGFLDAYGRWQAHTSVAHNGFDFNRLNWLFK